MNVIPLQLAKDEKIAFALDLHYDNRTPESRIDDLMETAERKLRDMLSKCVERNVKHLFFAGDVVNRTAISFEAFNSLCACFLEFRTAGIELYTICGNHDIVRASLENLEKSPIQTLFTLGVVKHINVDSRVIINKSVMITPVDYVEYPPVADSQAKVNILLAHMFYDASELLADERHNLSKEAVDKLGYDVLVLGHDHERYPVTKRGKSLIYRNGSILRGTAHNYNFTREPSFLVFNDLENIGEDTIEEVVLEHKNFEDIASSYVLNRKKLSNVSGLQDILSNLAERLAESNATDGDRIWDIISSDPNLSPECRALIMKYLTEN